MSIFNIRRINKKIVLGMLSPGIVGFLAGHYSANQNSTVVTNAQALSQNDHVEHQVVSTSYVCPMHPEYVSDKPGDCPICGMQLVSSNHTLHHHSNAFPAVSISPKVAQNLGIRLVEAKTTKMERHIETIGKITRIDPTARQIVTPPINGELVYIIDKYDGDEVNRGDHLFSVVSPELLTVQQQFQETYNAGDHNGAASMIPRLQQYGLSAEQIAALQQGSAPDMAIQVHAREDSFIFSRRGVIGDNVHTGFTVFNLAGNTQVVEVTAEIFERQWGWVKTGQAAVMTVRGLPGVSFTGQVVRVEPPVGYTTRSLEIKIKFKTNHPGLSQSMFAHIDIAAQSKPRVLQVPSNAVIRTGRGDRIVKLLPDGQYQPVTVVCGEESGEMIEILSGLQDGDVVISSGQFLIDSESNLQADLSRMTARHVKESKPAVAVDL